MPVYGFVITADGPFRLHNLGEMRVSSSSAAVTEPPSLEPLSSNRTVDATGRSSGDATSPGLSSYSGTLKSFVIAFPVKFSNSYLHQEVL